ncbi:hypothetical protein DFH11DRAFT_1503243 [Phellopilus nigrolimitatus]|nr:hypothetical protein DFH11DRAFT_1503243 [Phellopilus nigrolimitatus]
MSPSPSPAPPAPKPMMRKREPPSLFHKKPSRPFALAAMQAANGTAPAPGATGTTTARTAQKAATPRASPIPKIKSSPSPGPSSVGVGVSLGGSPLVKTESKPDVKLSLSAASTPPSTQGSSQGADAALPYQEFNLVSCDRHGWRYDVMKFDARRPVEIANWAQPVKLNRKELRREAAGGDAAGAAAPTPVGPMLGPDGKPVMGADGRIVMVDADGRPIHDGKVAGGAAGSSAAGKGAAGADGKDDKKKKKFQKKTRQVFKVPEHVRQLRREERYPWVMEDANGAEIWEGRMEEAAKSETHGLFMPAPDNVFRFVSAHRWYKFQKRRPQTQMWTLEEAEKMMAKMQKKKDSERWLMRQRNGNSAGGPSLVYESGGRSQAPGGRRLRTVDNGMRGLFEEDDEDGMQDRRRRERERGGDGDMDEMEYEEDFADDEEKMQPDGMDDEETKEIEERLKREYRNANKTRESYIDESEEEDDIDNLTGAGKDMKKLVRKIEKNAAYDSDEDKNPYASSEEEEEEEAPEPTPTGPAVQVQSNMRSTSQAQASPKPGDRPPSKASSRTGSPAPLSVGVKVKSEGTPLSVPPQSPILGMGGHSVVAKRATSPKAPKLKNQSGSRATSPLAGGAGSRAGSPNPPPASPVASRAGSPPAPGSTPGSKKRKAEDGAAGAPPVSGGSMSGAQPKPKKRKPTNAGAAGAPAAPGAAAGAGASAGGPPPPTVAPDTELTAELLVSWMRAKPGTTTRECIRYFQPCLTDEKKKVFTRLVKEVANMKDGVLMLKQQYKDGGEDVKVSA